MDPNMPTGRRIAAYRRRRGLSQEVCANLVGRTGAWLSQIERGARPIDRLSVLEQLAEVLRVEVADLTGRQESGDRMRPQNAAASALRSVLLRHDAIAAMLTPIEDGTAEGPTLAGIRRGVDLANRLYQATRYEAAAQLLTELVGHSQRATRELTGDDRRRAYGLLAEVYHVTAKTLTRVGEPGLSWIVAERALNATERSEQPLLIAASAYHLGHSFLQAGQYGDAIAVTAATADGMDSKAPSSAWVSVVGGLHLTTALAAARHGDRVVSMRHLNRAGTLAEQLGRDGNDFWLAFGPSNVAIHRLACTVELLDPAEAIRQGEAIDLSWLPLELLGRRSQVLVELARGYTQRRRDADALQALLTAERLAPEMVRSSDVVRGVVRDLVGRPRRKLSADLRHFAERTDALI